MHVIGVAAYIAVQSIRGSWSVGENDITFISQDAVFLSMFMTQATAKYKVGVNRIRFKHMQCQSYKC